MFLGDFFLCEVVSVVYKFIFLIVYYRNFVCCCFEKYKRSCLLMLVWRGYWLVNWEFNMNEMIILI